MQKACVYLAIQNSSKAALESQQKGILTQRVD